MVHPQDRPSTTAGSRHTRVDSAVIPAGPVSNQPRGPEIARGNSTKPQSDLIRKAHAGLQDELKSRTSLETEALPMDAFPGLQDFESTVEPLHQQPGTLVKTFMDLPKHRPESLTHMSSRLTRIEGLQPEDHFQPIVLLKIPLPVSPGQTGHIDFTLFNDDPTATAEHTLYTTNLVGMSGQRIPETYITVFPNPARIPPGESIDGRIEIHVPSGTSQGSYGGLLQTEDVTGLQAVIRLSVGF